MSEPKIGVAAIVFHQDKVLLIQRANEPGKGQWTFPGGKLQAGETLQHAAERETYEETRVKVTSGNIAHTFEMIEYDHNNNLKFHYIIIDLDARYVEGTPQARDDARDAKWVSKTEVASLELNQETLNLLNNKYQFIL
jgi:mutator protein MutT